MNVIFEWKKEFEIGVEEVDEQHRTLFQMAETLDKNLNPLHAKKVIMELYKYTRIHFDTEERVMREVGYPKYTEHVKLHEALITTLNEISTKDFNNEAAILDLRRVVYDWLVDHISHDDMEIGKYVESTT